MKIDGSSGLVVLQVVESDCYDIELSDNEHSLGNDASSSAVESNIRVMKSLIMIQVLVQT